MTGNFVSFKVVKLISGILVIFIVTSSVIIGQSRARDHGIKIGVILPGPYNAITDVDGVLVGHYTMIRDSTVRTGITVVMPHDGNIFQDKVPAAIYAGNGFGKLAGTTQVEELGNIETPIVLTNTLSVGPMVAALVDYTLTIPGNEQVRSVNAVVGETNDGYLNNIREQALSGESLEQAISDARGGRIAEGNIGAGTGTICFGWKGGIGTASRKLPESLGGYTVGVLVQSNFGGSLRVDGVPVGEELGNYYLADQLKNADGSCMIVIATDAPMLSRNLKRLAKRSLFGLARAGGIGSNGSGDYAIAFSTHSKVRVSYGNSGLLNLEILTNNVVTPLFAAVIEATEEAIINSLFAAEDMIGFGGRKVAAMPKEKVIEIFEQYRRED